MDDKLNDLKEKQQEIGDKIRLLQATNKKKDEETEEIRQLIAECRENLNRIKGIAPNSEIALTPCSEILNERVPGSSDPDFTVLQSATDDETPTDGGTRRNGSRRSKGSKGSGIVEESAAAANEWKSLPEEERGLSMFESVSPIVQYEESLLRTKSRDPPTSTPKKRQSDGVSYEKSQKGLMEDGGGNQPRGSKDDSKRPCSQKSGELERKRCAEILAKNKKRSCETERVSCKIDLHRMKVRIKGPPEDLKKLDASQLVNLLEKFQCQELIINTGEENSQDPGEVCLVYLTHPGNIVMAVGILLVAFLMNANLCNTKRSYKMKFFLNILYLSSFACHYGMVLWMTFLRGCALKFGLNSDTFHLVDSIILPKYFSVCALLSAVSLYAFLATHFIGPCTTWPLDVIIQMIIMVVTFFAELVTICYIIPALLKLRDATDDVVLDEDDPDCFVPASYEKNLAKLKRINWTLCLINFLTIIFFGANIYYITSKVGMGNDQ